MPSIPPRTFRLRSAAWLRKGNPDAAVRDFDAAIRLDPKLSTAYRDRGIVTANNGEWVKSIADLDQAILLSPGDGLAFAQRGRARAAQSETARAIEDFDEAIRVDPRLGTAYLMRARLRATCPDPKCRDGAKAVEDAKRGCTLLGNHAESLDILAAAYAEAGNFNEAIRWQTQALADPVFARTFGPAGRVRLGLYELKKPYHETSN